MKFLNFIKLKENLLEILWWIIKTKKSKNIHPSQIFVGLGRNQYSQKQSVFKTIGKWKLKLIHYPLTIFGEVENQHKLIDKIFLRY